MMNYMNELGPPTKYNSELTKKQWKRIQKADYSYETLDEKKKKRSQKDLDEKERRRYERDEFEQRQRLRGRDGVPLEQLINAGIDVSMTESQKVKKDKDKKEEEEKAAKKQPAKTAGQRRAEEKY